MRENGTRTPRSSVGPSAAYRAARPAMVYVFPVPALASSTVTPDGSSPQTSNGAGAMGEVTGAPSVRAQVGRPTAAVPADRDASPRPLPNLRRPRPVGAPSRA